MEILQLENVSFSYPKAEKPALSEVSLQVESGAFVVACGETGCGKTTLLKLLKRALSPVGTQGGSILYNGETLASVSDSVAAAEIGYVLQNPENQIVTDKVWHELAFGLANLGLPSEVIRRRVAEIANYFGIQNWFRKETDTLSGGQKQLLNLASVMAMQPKVLLLDEPTAQLDPIAASAFIATLQKLNRELGLTILLVEHRLEEVFPIADKVLMLEQGRVLFYDTPRNVGQQLKQLHAQHPMLLSLPSAVRIFHALPVQDDCPLTVREGRDFLQRHFQPAPQAPQPPARVPDKPVAISMENVWFRYKRDLPDVLRGVHLQAFAGEVYGLLGGNGCGKTTLLHVAAGLDKAYRGEVRIHGKKCSDYKGNRLYRNRLAFLPQNPQTVFLEASVQEDFMVYLQAIQCPAALREARVREVSDKLQIGHLLGRHPYDLSGGEQQKCALAKLLLAQPSILLLDEPTKGLDAFSKQQLHAVLTALKQEGLCVLMATHDVEFAAENADRCALLFDGEILSVATAPAFFAENSFYTTAANRMARRLYPQAVTCAAVVTCCLENGGGENA